LRALILFTILSTAALNLAYGAYENVKTYKDHISHLKYAEVDNKKIAYIDEGNGEAIVLMHGIPTNSWMFRKMIPDLVKSGYRVIAPDLLGMGQSEKVRDKKEILVPAQAKIIMSLISDNLGLTSWKHLVHDFGGPVTFEMMEDARFNASEFIFLNTPLFKDGFKPGLNIGTKAVMGIVTSKPLRKLFYKNAIKAMVTDKKSMTSDDLNGYLNPLMNGASYTYKCLYFTANKIQDEFIRYQKNVKSLSNIPVKVIWGENDKFLSSSKQVGQLQELLELSSDDITILKNKKHLITEEMPSEIIEIILK
jgi:pimeloyl-ACP methyl ester carboxylesterase